MGEDKFFFKIKPEPKKEFKKNRDIPNFGDKLLIKNTIKFYLYLEGKNEEDYFKELKKKFCSSKLNVELFKPKEEFREGCNSKLLVEQFEKKRRLMNYQEEDKFFLIFDRDQNHKFPKSKSEKRLDYCIKKCKQISITPIFSNPCFEVWLICHFKKPKKKRFPFESKEVKKMYKAMIAGDSMKSLICRKKINRAKFNAKKIYKERLDKKINIYSKKSYPVTEVFRLVEILEKELL